jgi:hypothetical protein
LAVHPAVASPVVLGGLRPVILVPADWDDWPLPQRRACLLHELSHLARYDDAVKLIQEILRVPFFFHPFVAWLLARLDRERELLCDETAVALGCDPIAYARLLVNLARRPGRLLTVAPLSRHGWLPFLDRRTIGTRIERLLEEDMPRTSPASWASRPLFIGAIGLVIALGAGGLRVSAVRSQETGMGVQPTNPDPQASQPRGQRKAPRELGGTVLDPGGRPISGATVVAGCDDEGRTGHQVLTTDEKGRFTWRVPEGAFSVFLVAHRKGLAAATINSPVTSFDEPLDLKLRLARPELLAAVLLDAKGRPVSAPRIRVRMLAHSSESGNTVSTAYEPIPWGIIAGSPLESLYSTTSNKLGAFTFQAFPPEVGARLEVTDANGMQLTVKSRAGVTGMMRQIMADQGFVTAPPGAWTRLEAVPAARIAGRVATTLPGVILSGLTANYQGSNPTSSYRPNSNFGGSVEVDAEGRFVFDGLAEGTVNVFVHGKGENDTWTYRAAKDVNLTPGKISDVALELIRGVEVEGTVVEQRSGSPLEGVELGVYGPFRPRSGAMTTGVKTDSSGRYHYRLPAGESFFYVMGHPDGFNSLPDGKSTRTVKIPEGAVQFKIPMIELIPPAPK